MLKKIFCSLSVAILIVAGQIHADDTELYLVDSTVRTGKHPQVLIIFDNSGSMSTEDTNTTSSYCSAADQAANKCSYPDGFATYLAGYSGYISQKGIYWNAGGIDNTSNAPTPDVPNDSRRFYADNNNCNKAAEALASRGRYTGLLREFKASGNTGKWTPLAENEGFNAGQIVDCYQDIQELDPKNPGREKQGNNYNNFVDGFPIDSKDMYMIVPANPTQTQLQNAQKTSLQSTAFGTGTPVTLYTAHYLVWYKWVTTTAAGQQSGGTGTRLEVAKKAIEDALTDITIPIDAGLAIFNLNYATEGNADGGRIVSAIKEMTSTNQTSLLSLINGMPAQTNTPLCETLYEAHQYFSGREITFGNKDANAIKQAEKIDGYVPNTPPSIINSGKYSSPFKKCPDTAYIIYITDGAPTLDHSADTLVQNLTNSAQVTANYSAFEFTNDKGAKELSYLPALAAYMANNDLIKDVKDANGIDNKQNVRTFTIGFTEGADIAAELLEETAFRGGNPRGENGISKGYYTAATGIKLTEALVGALKSILSIDSSFTSPSIASNNFDKTQTYNSAYFAMFLPSKGPRWSGNLKKLKVNSTGEIVGPGGETNAIDSNGNISASTCTYWNVCPSESPDGNTVTSGGVLPALRSALKNRKIKSLSGSSLVNITSTSFVSDHSQADLDWLYGVDVDDDNNSGSTTDARADIMGDPLHSKPLAINFGKKGASLDVRVLVGTNQGLVHMFKDSDTGNSDFSIGSVVESWAFIPPELWANIPKLRENSPTGEHSVYGMDLSPVAYTETNKDGEVDKAWVFLGMRRGGTSYYALDITAPDSPIFKWKIDSSSEGFEDLGQSWSEPVVTLIPGHSAPVLVFGGGLASAEGAGEAVYIADADTGEHLYTFTSAGMSSIPNKVAVLDSNNDGHTDRIYATDITGNVWRMDMPSSFADSGNPDWSIFKFASISSSSLSSENRMFFAEPVIAQTQFNNVHSEKGVLSYQSIPYDAVTVGTGNRTHPLDTTTNDMFYVFQDRNVVTKQFSGSDIPEPLTVSSLYDVTSSAPASQADNISFGNKRGWFYDFTSLGEKSLSASLIFDGKVYFTSFVPPADQVVNLDVGICGFSGQGRLYVFDLHKGTRTSSTLYYDVGERVPDTPQIVIPPPEEGDEAEAYLIGIGKAIEAKDLGSGLKTNKIYYHIDE